MKLRCRILLGVLGLIGATITALVIAVSHNAECPLERSQPRMASPNRAVTIGCYGGPEVLSVREIEKPDPTENELLVKVHFAALNPLDWHYMRGEPYFMRLGDGMGRPPSERLGVDFAGTVEAVGSKVTRFKPGDAVFGGRSGAFAEYIMCSRRVPSHTNQKMSRSKKPLA